MSNMNYIENKANEFIRFHFISKMDTTRSGIIVEKAKDVIYDIDEGIDKAQFLYKVLEANNAELNQHLPNCKNPDKCSINAGHEEFRYKMNQELNRIGIRTDENVFNLDEKFNCDIMINDLISHINDFKENLKQELQDLKDGNQIIYDDIIEELQELKNLYIVGKKNWWKLCSVELTKMVVSGLIDETVVKNIVGFSQVYLKNGLKFLNG